MLGCPLSHRSTALRSRGRPYSVMLTGMASSETPAKEVKGNETGEIEAKNRQQKQERITDRMERREDKDTIHERLHVLYTSHTLHGDLQANVLTVEEGRQHLSDVFLQITDLHTARAIRMTETSHTSRQTELLHEGIPVCQ